MSPKLPRRWSLDHNPLSGITLGRWLKLLVDNRFDVDVCYAHRAAFISALSAFNSACAAWECLRFGRALRGIVVRKDPIFIIGHWRSGTTHLHNLLSLDDALTAPTTFQAVNPSSFLSTDRVLPAIFKPFLPARRPMDEMTMSFEAPQEDELALSLLCGLSPYLSLSFPRGAPHYDRYLTFENAPAQEVLRWKEAFIKFASKLTLRDERRLVYKSPAHTARIRILLELFPDARFLHIHRDPYVVFQSSRHYFGTAAWHANLQRLDPDHFDDAILRRYQVLYAAYFDQRHIIPPGRLHELSYDSLIADPLAEMRRIYQELELGSWATVQSKVRDYLGSLGDYQVNRHQDLSAEERGHVATAWRPYFQALGYPIGFDSAATARGDRVPCQEAGR